MDFSVFFEICIIFCSSSRFLLVTDEMCCERYTPGAQRQSSVATNFIAAIEVYIWHIRYLTDKFAKLRDDKTICQISLT